MGRPVNFPDPSADPPQKQAANRATWRAETETEKKARATQEAALAAVGTVDEASTAAAAARAKQEASVLRKLMPPRLVKSPLEQSRNPGV